MVEVQKPARTINGIDVTSNVPLSFSFAKYCIKNKLPGAWKLFAILQKTLLSKSIIEYKYNGVRPSTIYAPLFRHESSMSKTEIGDYDFDGANEIKQLLKNYQQPIWYVDVGADIGMICLQMIRVINNLEKIVAFEPNDNAFPYLEAMLNENGIDAKAIKMAIGNHAGRGEMVSPPKDNSEHARYFHPTPNGPIEMTKIDTLPKPEGKVVVLKVDVEGSEFEVLKGAEEFLRTADEFIITFEVHPQVIKRTNQQPSTIIQFLNTIRQCKTALVTRPDIIISADKKIEDQIPNFHNGVHNLICSSISE